MAIDQANEDPLIVIALALDRLRCGVELLCTLLLCVMAVSASLIPLMPITMQCVDLATCHHTCGVDREFMFGAFAGYILE